MTTKTTMTRTIRLAIGTAAVLALMSQAAQARPSGLPAPTGSTHVTASSSILKNKLELPATVIKSSAVSPANNVAAAHANDRATLLVVPPARGQVTQLTPPTQTVDREHERQLVRRGDRRRTRIRHRPDRDRRCGADRARTTARPTLSLML